MYCCLGQKIARMSKCQNSSSVCCIYTSLGTEDSQICKLAFSFHIYILFLNCTFSGGWEGLNRHVDIYSRRCTVYFFLYFDIKWGICFKNKMTSLGVITKILIKTSLSLQYYWLSISGLNTHEHGEDNTNN